MAKQMTFIEVLNDEQGRELVATIEDLLDSNAKQDPMLQGHLSLAIAELKAQTGFQYSV